MTLQDYELNRDVRAAIAAGESPDTPAGQALVARWRDVIERFTGGDRTLKQALLLVTDDRKHLPGPAWTAGYREFFARALGAAS